MALSIGDSKVSKLYLGDAECKKAYLGDTIVLDNSVPAGPKIYGATWDGTSTTKWTRTDDAIGFSDPIPYVAGVTAYSSPFDNIMPWAGMTIEERTGGTMVKIPKFWYQLTQNTPGTPSSGMTIRIANEPVEGFSASPAHTDRGDGHGERDAVYVGRYHCATSSFKSETNKNPRINLTRANFRTYIHRLGSTIWQLDIATRFTIWLLYLVEFANWNSQECIGYGCGNKSGVENMGYTDSMPYHTGTTQTSRTTYGLGAQYRNIEGLWDNCYDLLDGCYNNASGLNIILNPNNFNDSSGGNLVGLPDSGGYPLEFTVSNKGVFPIFYPFKCSGNAEDSFGLDTWSFSESYPITFVGGSYICVPIVGMFHISISASNSTGGNRGSRIIELP